jgi:hypothetical protein
LRRLLELEGCGLWQDQSSRSVLYIGRYKALLIQYGIQGIDTFDKEKSALLSVVDKVAGAIFSGQVYYEIYNPERTGRKDVVDRLYNAIVMLYGCVLQLLVTSSDLSSNTAVQFCQAVFDTAKPSGMLLELERLEQELATAAGKCEETAHAHQEVIFKDYLQEAEKSLKRITRHMEHVFLWVDNQERRDLLEWISDVQYGRHHDEIEERREPGTGDWLVQDERFRDWMDSSLSSTLWLQGSREPAQSSKSIISLTKASWHGKIISDFSCGQAYRGHEGTPNGRIWLFLLQSRRERSAGGTTSASKLSSPVRCPKRQYRIGKEKPSRCTGKSNQ